MDDMFALGSDSIFQMLPSGMHNRHGIRSPETSTSRRRFKVLRVGVTVGQLPWGLEIRYYLCLHPWGWYHVMDNFLDPLGVPQKLLEVFLAPQNNLWKKQFLSYGKASLHNYSVLSFFSVSPHSVPSCQVNFLIRQARHLSVAWNKASQKHF